MYMFKGSSKVWEVQCSSCWSAFKACC